MLLIQAVFLIGFPAVIIWFTRRYKKVSFLNPILLCYLVGIIIANLPNLDQNLSMTLSEISVPMAIPLLLFSTHFSRWLRLAKKTILSFVLVMFSAFASALAAGMLFASRVEEFWKVSGMLVGVYTGGTPNLMAIGLSLGVREETYILVHTADVIIGGLYIIFLMFAAKKLLRLFLPEFKMSGVETGDYLEDKEERFRNLDPKTKILKTASSLGIAALILAAGAGLSMLISGDLSVGIVILVVTTLGIAGSFIQKIRESEAPYFIGHYLLLVFSLAVGSTVEIEQMLSASPTIFLFTATAMLGAILLHFILAAIFRIDADTVIITSTASIYGPPFVAPVAAVLKNRELLVPGLLCGLVGYALGNYIGLSLAFLLTRF